MQKSTLPNSLFEPLALVRSAAGRRRVVASSDLLDDFLDVYASTSAAVRQPSPALRCELERFFFANKSSLYASVLLLGASLYAGQTPTTIYPAVLLRELVRDLDGRAKPTPATRLLERMKARDPTGFAPFAAALTEVDRSIQAGAWPSPALAGLALARLGLLRSSWAASEAEARRAVDGVPLRCKDPAHRRALAWYGLCERLLSSLASPERGELRALLDYLLGLLAYFEDNSRRAEPSSAACTALVLEVFSAATNCSISAPDAESSELLLGKGQRGSPSTIRKQLQKARLRAAQRSEGRIDDRTWDELLLPILRELGPASLL